jgi:hypothetical protein
MKNSRLVMASLSLLLGVASSECGGGDSSREAGNAGDIAGITASCAAYIAEGAKTDQCTATVTGSGAFNSTVKWRTSAGSIDSTGLLTLPASTGSVTVTATAAGDSTKTATETVTVAASVNSGFTLNGITHVSWSAGEYSTAAGKMSQDALAAAGGNWAGVMVTYYMPTYISTTIAPTSGGPSTPSDADVVAAIGELHAMGLKVMLKPHVDTLDGYWRGQIAPTDVNAWFTSYDGFIVHFAQLAEANGVEMLCIGTELASMSGSSYLTNWTNTIRQIRNAFSGPLVYAANAASTNGDEYTSVSFWNQLDVIGLDAYFSLTNHARPTLRELISAWSSNKNGENIVAALENFAAAHPNQPVIFTEIGYRSVAGGNINPWDWNNPALNQADTTEQRDCYEAMYEVWSQQSAIKGNFWWAWPVPAPNVSTDTDYSTWKKPAEGIEQTWQ